MKTKSLKRVGILLIGMMAMMTSCVQGDLYELYEEDDLSFSIARNKKSKEGVYPAQCGVCCLSYLSGIEPRRIEAIAHDSCNIDCGGNDDPLTGSKILEISRKLNCNLTDWLGTRFNGVIDYSPLINILSSLTGNFIVDIDNSHFVVGTRVNQTKKGEWYIYTVDPQNSGSQASYSISSGRVWGVIY